MPDRDKVSRCFLSVTLLMFLLALAANVTPVAYLDGMAHQSTTAVSDTKRGGMLAAGTPHGPIAIDGDANFADTALLEGWPGDGSPENPFIIDGLDIDLDGNNGSCIIISNTQVSFVISNCSLTGASEVPSVGAGIFLYGVTNGELARNILYGNRRGIKVEHSDNCIVTDNTCDSSVWGIILDSSSYNTVADNTSKNNTFCGIVLRDAHSNTVADNTCDSNGADGIYLRMSQFNTISDNTCTNNSGGFDFAGGIFLDESDSNTVSDNTCFRNFEDGIDLAHSDSNTVDNNTCNSNEIGISLFFSRNNTVVNSFCSNNRIGISLSESDSNIAANNTCKYNEIGISMLV